MSGWYDFVQWSTALALDVNKLQPDILSECLWHFSITAKYKSVKTGIVVIANNNKYTVYLIGVTGKISLSIQIYLFSALLQWRDFYPGRLWLGNSHLAGRNEAQQTSRDWIYWCVVTLQWHAVKCLCKSQFLSVKWSCIIRLMQHLNHQVCCAKLGNIFSFFHVDIHKFQQLLALEF